MSKSNGIIIILAYPDTVVKPSKRDVLSTVLPYLGIGTKNGIQAGHAALLLIKKGVSEINYFDFGRYITTDKNGRVRSKETDFELHIPILAKFNNTSLSNLEEILVWLERHPEKTHGAGRLVASVNENIDYEKALGFINTCINQKEIPYGAFIRNGSNCARFVTDTLRVSSLQKKIKTKLTISYLCTPSPIGNVLKGKTTKNIYQVYNTEVNPYTNRSILKEYKKCFFNKFDAPSSFKEGEIQKNELFHSKKATWLGGCGSGAWFAIEEKLNTTTYKVSRYTYAGKKDFEGEFKMFENCFDINLDYQFTHPTNCLEAFIVQKKKKFTLRIITN
ncbi:hypothetical protein N9Q68_01785 [Polaribacter sp.]|nr:hypothetical protein [Polaribacter sp.]